MIFIDYKDDEKVIPLCIILHQMSARARNFDELNVPFLINAEFFAKYIKSCCKVGNNIKTDFDSKPVDN